VVPNRSLMDDHQMELVRHTRRTWQKRGSSLKCASSRCILAQALAIGLEWNSSDGFGQDEPSSVVASAQELHRRSLNAVGSTRTLDLSEATTATGTQLQKHCVCVQVAEVLSVLRDSDAIQEVWRSICC